MNAKPSIILIAMITGMSLAATHAGSSRVQAVSTHDGLQHAAQIRATLARPMMSDRTAARDESALVGRDVPAVRDPYATVVAEPSVPVPSMLCGTSQLDNLLLDQSNDYQVNFVASEPVGCPKWAKVLLEVDYQYTDDIGYPAPAGIALWLGGANLFFGGAPSVQDPPGAWHAERDVTDYATLIRHGPNNGRIAIDPAFLEANPDLAMRVSFRFKFYAPTATEGVPRKADLVQTLSSRYGAMTEMRTGENHPTLPPTRLAMTATLPRNVEHAYLDVLALGVGSDWVWWSCVPAHFYQDMPDLLRDYPNVYDSRIGSCLRGAFREAVVRIDGVPAGVAPVFPWIPPAALTDSTPRYAMFRPTPPPRALNVMPYRVDLSPFAGVLSDGTPHEIAVTIASSEPSIDMEATAALIVFRDPHSTTVSGAVTRNTLAGQSTEPTINENLVETGGHVTGDLHTVQNRHFVIEGYVDTARGRVKDRVEQTDSFDNVQTFDVLRTAGLYSYHQTVRLLSRVNRTSQKTLGSRQLRLDRDNVSYPLVVSDKTSWPRRAPGEGVERLALSQGLHAFGAHKRPDIAWYTTHLDETYDGLVHTRASDPSLYIVMSAQDFNFTDARGSCFSAALTTQDGAITDFVAGARCPGGVNAVRWFARPDGSPDSLIWAGYN